MYKMTTWRWAMDFVNEITADRPVKEVFALIAEKTGRPGRVS
jgi:hypothetical protein